MSTSNSKNVTHLKLLPLTLKTVCILDIFLRASLMRVNQQTLSNIYVILISQSQKGEIVISLEISVTSDLNWRTQIIEIQNS